MNAISQQNFSYLFEKSDKIDKFSPFSYSQLLPTNALSASNEKRKKYKSINIYFFSSSQW